MAKKIFISQPMAGRSAEELKEERERIIFEIKDEMPDDVECDIELIDNLNKDKFCDGTKRCRVRLLGMSISMMADADLVFFAKGWENSKGCRVERWACVEYDIPFVSES